MSKKTRKQTPGKIPVMLGGLYLLAAFSLLSSQDLLTNLGKPQNYISKRISSFDRTGGNADRLTIGPGETAILAEIKGPAAIHHIWVTIAAEPFYGRKIILRMYWDGEKEPSVEAPIGDFFGVGQGLNRNFSSLPINCSSEGRARNCYWYMPFRQSARITVTNEGSEIVGAFYYYIDYRELSELAPETPYFHAQYRQETPCLPEKNYLILEAEGQGHYVGCNLSILQRAMGWWGEGDDMIYVDDEEFPSLYGTGSEDYFSDAWGMREGENPFYGCPLQEPDFQVGAKATVYRFHIPDPIPFKKSIKVTIEHGHANDRSDYFSSVAYWYQTEPHPPFPALPAVEARLPFALATPRNFIFPGWEENEESREKPKTFIDQANSLQFRSDNLSLSLTSFYNQQGDRYPVLLTEDAQAGTEAELSFKVRTGERYDIDLYFLQGPGMGKIEVPEIRAEGRLLKLTGDIFDGYFEENKAGKLTLRNVRLYSGINTLILRAAGHSPQSKGMDMGFLGLALSPSSRRFSTEWNLVGPFEAPEMTYLQVAYPPEKEIDFSQGYEGKDKKQVRWKKARAEETGFIRLESIFKPNERAIAYGLVYVFSSEEQETEMLVGSDDGVRVWLNDTLIHSNPAYRGAYPDQDRVQVNLHQGWNKVLVKVLQGGGGWGFYLRFIDPENTLRFSLEPK